MHILIATDAQWVLDEVRAALESPSTTFEVITNGREVAKAVAGRAPDIAILDMQVGNMGAMAITMDLRLDESSGALPRVPVLMLLDRFADVHMARRSGADGWTIKPLDALRLGKAVRTILAGGTHTEGVTARVTEDVSEQPTAHAAESPAETADSLAH